MNSKLATNSSRYRESLMGRLPMLREDRPYRSYFVSVSVFFAYGVATWAFLTGGLIGTVIDAPHGITAFFVGQLAGLVIGAFSIGFLCHRYGVELVDGVKAAFGPFGAMLVLVASLLNFLGWAYILMILSARSAMNVLHRLGSVSTSVVLIGVIAVVVMAVTVVLTTFGPEVFARISTWVAPALLVMALTMIGLMVNRFGLPDLFTMTSTGSATPGNYTLVVEWGLAFGLSYWVVIGPMVRLIPSMRVATVSMLTGWGVVAIVVIAAGTLAATTLGSSDPTEWMFPLAGAVGGSVGLIFVIMANVTTTIAMLYIAGLQVQQFRIARQMPWGALISLLALPGIYFAFRPSILMDHYGAFLGYNAVAFAPLAAVMLVDYLLLRKQRIVVRDLFDKTSFGRYWFWFGVNPAAILAVALGCAFYLWLFNPITSEGRDIFYYITASLPTTLFSAVLYYVAMRFVVIPLGKGDYPVSGHR